MQRVSGSRAAERASSGCIDNVGARQPPGGVEGEEKSRVDAGGARTTSPALGSQCRDARAHDGPERSNGPPVEASMTARGVGPGLALSDPVSCGRKTGLKPPCEIPKDKLCRGYQLAIFRMYRGQQQRFPFGQNCQPYRVGSQPSIARTVDCLSRVSIPKHSQGSVCFTGSAVGARLEESADTDGRLLGGRRLGAGGR